MLVLVTNLWLVPVESFVPRSCLQLWRSHLDLRPSTLKGFEETTWTRHLVAKKKRKLQPARSEKCGFFFKAEGSRIHFNNRYLKLLFTSPNGKKKGESITDTDMIIFWIRFAPWDQCWTRGAAWDPWIPMWSIDLRETLRCRPQAAMGDSKVPFSSDYLSSETIEWTWTDSKCVNYCCSVTNITHGNLWFPGFLL